MKEQIKTLEKIVEQTLCSSEEEIELKNYLKKLNTKELREMSKRAGILFID